MPSRKVTPANKARASFMALPGKKLPNRVVYFYFRGGDGPLVESASDKPGPGRNHVAGDKEHELGVVAR